MLNEPGLPSTISGWKFTSGLITFSVIRDGLARISVSVITLNQVCYVLAEIIGVRAIRQVQALPAVTLLPNSTRP